MKLIQIISTCLFLSACCSERSDFVPFGYPFDPNITQLNFVDYMDRIGPRDSMHTDFVLRDSNTAIDYFKYVNNGSFTNYVDYSKYDVIRVRYYDDWVHYTGFQIRVLVNHKTKDYYIEINTKTNSCYDYTLNGSTLDKYIKIPKIPAGYKFTPYKLY